MKKRVAKPTQQMYDEVTACDVCGEESLQDDFVQQHQYDLGITLDVHGKCISA